MSIIPSFRSVTPLLRSFPLASSLSSSSFSFISSSSSSFSSSLSSSIPSCSPLPSSSFHRSFSSYSFHAPNPFLSHQTTASQMHSTTILTVRKNNEVVVIGDGQVSLGPTVVKGNAKKVRRIDNGRVIVGFAGSTADCFTLMDRLEKKMEEYPGQLLRASVELAKEWRSDKYLRQLEAWMIACDKDLSVTITGNGDVLSDPGHGVMGIGSGSLYAVAAARALIPIEGLKAKEIGERAMKIAADICVYTNGNFVIETFEADQQTSNAPTNNPSTNSASSSTNTSSASSTPSPSSSPTASSMDPKMF